MSRVMANGIYDGDEADIYCSVASGTYLCFDSCVSAL